MSQKQRVKRKIITKHVHRDLRPFQAQQQYINGMHQATSVALNLYANKFQLKDLAEQFETSFKYKHPTHTWHVEGQAYEPEPVQETGKELPPDGEMEKALEEINNK